MTEADDSKGAGTQERKACLGCGGQFGILRKKCEKCGEYGMYCEACNKVVCENHGPQSVWRRKRPIGWGWD